MQTETSLTLGKWQYRAGAANKDRMESERKKWHRDVALFLLLQLSNRPKTLPGHCAAAVVGGEYG